MSLLKPVNMTKSFWAFRSSLKVIDVPQVSPLVLPIVRLAEFAALGELEVDPEGLVGARVGQVELFPQRIEEIGVLRVDDQDAARVASGFVERSEAVDVAHGENSPKTMPFARLMMALTRSETCALPVVMLLRVRGHLGPLADEDTRPGLGRLLDELVRHGPGRTVASGSRRRVSDDAGGRVDDGSRRPRASNAPHVWA